MQSWVTDCIFGAGSITIFFIESPITAFFDSSIKQNFFLLILLCFITIFVLELLQALYCIVHIQLHLLVII